MRLVPLLVMEMEGGIEPTTVRIGRRTARKSVSVLTIPAKRSVED